LLTPDERVHVHSQEKSIKVQGKTSWHKLAFREWTHSQTEGPSSQPTVLLVHGLTQNSHTFDVLAEYITGKLRYRCICPDVVGRGNSSWMTDPANYSYEQYVRDIGTLITFLDSSKLFYFGTSMGGLIGIMAASYENCPIQKLVINDIGPFCPKEALGRIGSYVGKNMTYEKIEDCRDYLAKIWAPFGLSGEVFTYILSHVAVQEQNKVRLHYDPAIAFVYEPYTSGKLEWADLDICPLWNKIIKDLPIMVIRGQNSDVLLPKTVDFMRSGRESQFTFLEVPNVGHAPMLFTVEEAKPIANFLSQ